MTLYQYVPQVPSFRSEIRGFADKHSILSITNDSYPLPKNLYLLLIRAGKITNLPATHLLPVFSVLTV